MYLPLGIRQLVAQTALEPAAQAGELRRIEAQLLLLGHLDRHRLEGGEKRRAAQGPAARSVAAKQLRLVADAHLTHLDARPELRRKLPNQLAEVDAGVGGEVEDQPRT